MKGYKLTDKDGYTRRGLPGETLWEVGKIVYPKGEGSSPCGPGVLHDYSTPLLAAFLNPIHADISNPKLFEVEHLGEVHTDGLKRWTTGGIRVVREIPLPKLSLENKVILAIHISIELTGDWKGKTSFVKWGQSWISNADRTDAAAYAARDAAAYAARDAAAYAASDAADAARDAAYAAYAAYAADAAVYAAYAARAAVYAAYAAVYAAAYAAHAPAYAAYAETFLKRLESLAEEVLNP